MTPDDEVIPEAVIEQATAWVVRLQDAPEDKELLAGFDAWRAESDVHARAWAKARKAWLGMGQVPPAFAHEWPQPGQTLNIRPERAYVAPRPRRRSPLRTVAVGLAACLLLAVLLTMRVWIAGDYATGTGETRQVALEDGSTVDLAGSSAIGIEFGDGRRQVSLLRGAAYFDVKPDRARPFSVSVQDLMVTVTGTAFDVSVTDRSYSVAVAHGSVRLASARKNALDLAAGQGVVIDRATGQMIATSPAPQAVGAWRKGQLIVENAALIDVVDAIGRSHRGTIFVTDSALREKRVTGAYDLRDPDRALRILAAPYGGVVREFTPWLLVLSGG